MIVRRLALAAAVVLTVAVSVTFAQPPVTVVLTNGQQYSGSLTGISGSGNIAIDANGRQMSWPESNVALVEFTPGQPTSQELQQVSNVPSNRSFLRNLINARTVALVLQNGQMVTGTLSGISNDGNQLTLVTQMMASLAGSVVGLGLIATRRGTMKYALPFGTFLAVGAAVAATAGPAVVAWYLGQLQ